MRRRTRFIAGLLTSVVLVFSLAERAWASTCPPAMEMSASSAAASHEMPDHDCMPGHHDERDGSDVPDCPFGPAGTAQGCVTAASLPAVSAVEIAPSPEDAMQIVSTETEPHLFLGSALFHPPKA